MPAGTVTDTLNGVEVTFAGVPTVAPGMVVVTFSPLTKLLPARSAIIEINGHRLTLSNNCLSRAEGPTVSCASTA